MAWGWIAAKAQGARSPGWVPGEAKALLGQQSLLGYQHLRLTGPWNWLSGGLWSSLTHLLSSLRSESQPMLLQAQEVQGEGVSRAF